MLFNWILLIPILGILCGMLAIYTNHRRKIAMIETGVKPEEPYKRWYLVIAGLSTLTVGAALRLKFQPIQPKTSLEDIAATTGSVLLFLGVGLLVSYFLILIISLRLTPQQTTERRDMMKALLTQLKSFKNSGVPIEIKAMDGSTLTGTIKDIIDDELVALEVPGQPQPTFISTNKIVSVRRT